MVDYSKWDNLDASDDEGDARKPRVHRFDGPQQVTIGGGRQEVQVTPAGQPGRDEEGADDGDAMSDDEPVEPADEDCTMQRPEEDRREDVLQCRALAERALRAGNNAEAVRLLEKAMRIGGTSCPGLEETLAVARRRLEPAAPDTGKPQHSEERRKNGGTVEGRYSWSQTRETVETNIFVPAGTKAKDVKVSVSETRVCVTVAGDKVLDGEWEFKVDPEEDPDWEVRDLPETGAGQRAVRLAVRKTVVPGGYSVVLWWKRLLKGDPAIEVEAIEDRKKGNAENFAKAWKEAHDSFREQAAKRTPITIDCSGEAGGGDTLPMQED